MEQLLRTPTTAGCSRSTTSWTTCPTCAARSCRSCRARSSAARSNFTAFDAGRGCPFQCSFCTIINVQGRKSRYRDADDVERLSAPTAAPGVAPVLHHRRRLGPQQELGADLRPPDRAAREGEDPLKFLIQVDTQCHKIPRFIEKADAGRLHRVFIGMESINPENLWRPPRSCRTTSRIPHHAAGVASRRVVTYRRLHPRLSRRHARVDRARHQDHPAGAADRHPGVLHADAAARLRRPQGPYDRGCGWTPT